MISTTPKHAIPHSENVTFKILPQLQVQQLVTDAVALTGHLLYYFPWKIYSSTLVHITMYNYAYLLGVDTQVVPLRVLPQCQADVPLV